MPLFCGRHVNKEVKRKVVMWRLNTTDELYRFLGWTLMQKKEFYWLMVDTNKATDCVGQIFSTESTSNCVATKKKSIFKLCD